jgi:hypothetical protein
VVRHGLAPALQPWGLILGGWLIGNSSYLIAT